MGFAPLTGSTITAPMTSAEMGGDPTEEATVDSTTSGDYSSWLGWYLFVVAIVGVLIWIFVDYILPLINTSDGADTNGKDNTEEN